MSRDVLIYNIGQNLYAEKSASKGPPRIEDMVCNECADHVTPTNNSCLSLRTQAVLYAEKKLEHLMSELNCTTESCVLAHPKTYTNLPANVRQAVVAEKRKNMLPAPPETISSLLSNINIDDRLALAANHADNKFVNLGFSMIDFNDGQGYSTKLSIPDIFDIINSNPDKKYFASVINHDYSSGGGTHWVVMMIAHEPRKLMLEYFNSSGTPPPSRVIRWATMFKEHAPAKLTMAKPVEYVQVLDRAMQHMSDVTECGVYSLYYILSRINGSHRDDFRDAKRTQKDMRAYRGHLFRSHK
jgi:hypothetical protein